MAAAEVILEREELSHHLPLPKVSLQIMPLNQPQETPPCFRMAVEAQQNFTHALRLAPLPRLVPSFEEASYPRLVLEAEEEPSATRIHKYDSWPGERKASREGQFDKQTLLGLRHEAQADLRSIAVLRRPRQASVTQASAHLPTPACQKELQPTPSQRRQLPKQAITVNKSESVRLPKQAMMSFSGIFKKPTPQQSLSGAARVATTFAKTCGPVGNPPPRTSFRTTTPSDTHGVGVPLLLRNSPKGQERNDLLLVGGVRVPLPNNSVPSTDKAAKVEEQTVVTTTAKTSQSESESNRVSSSLFASGLNTHVHEATHQEVLRVGPVVGPPMLVKTVEPGITLPIPFVSNSPPANVNSLQVSASGFHHSVSREPATPSFLFGSSGEVAQDGSSTGAGLSSQQLQSHLVERNSATQQDPYREKVSAVSLSDSNCGGISKEVLWGCESIDDQSFLCRSLDLIYGALFRPDPDYVGSWEPLIASQFYTEVPRPVTQLTFRWDWAHLALYPDRGEYLWARADGQGRGPAPQSPWRGTKSIDYHELTLLAEISSGPLSAIVALPYRSVNPGIYADSAAGFSDLSITGKGLLFDSELLLVSFLLKTSVPTGNFNKGLGAGHVSLEPSIVAGLRVGPRTYGVAQLAQWIPIGGDRDYAGAALRWNFALNQMLWKPIPDVQLIGSFEVMGLSFQDGAYTDPILGSDQKLSGQTFVSLSPGARLFCANTCDLGLAYAFGVTGMAYAHDQIRLEFRYRY